jgi:nucleoside-diphosphate-sugar epimerase
MLKNEKVFLTGGAGFIGTALTRRLLQAGNEVIVYDTFLRNSYQYFPELNGHANLKIVQGDVRDRGKVIESIEDSTYVFHLAAIAGVSKYFRIPAEVMEINILGTFNILEAVKKRRDLKLLVDFSTSEIYGSDCFGAREEGLVKMEKLTEKRWTYAASKLASEKIGLSYFWQYDIPFVAVRPFNVYGPGQIGEGGISYFLNNAIHDKPLTVTGDGSQARTFCFIDDFIHGLEVICSNTSQVIGQSYNIGVETGIISMYDLALMVGEVSGKPLEILFSKHQGEDVMVRSPNIQKIRGLGYSPRVALREGLKKTLDWYIEKKVSLD